MAKVLILGQRRSGESNRVQIRGVFSQKKKLWEQLESLADLNTAKLLDDVTRKESKAKYNLLCGLIAKAGRVTIVDSNGDRQFIVWETETNQLRDWDTDEEGPVYNPTKKEALVEKDS